MNKTKYKTIIAILFFVFFMTPILSPSIGGSTIYIHWFIPLLDIDFIKEIISKNIKKEYIIMGIIFLVVCVILLKVKLALEVILMVESILYLMYCYKNDYFKYLYWGININIVIAIIQFIVYYISPEWANAIGPSNIANLIWGSHATQTFTNMFPNELGIVRVSGWSREAGFFNSLIIITTLVYYYVDNKTKKSKVQYVLFAIGFLISLSKISLLPIIVIPIIKLRKYIDKIPYIIGILLILLVGVGTSDFLFEHNQYDKEKSVYYETFSHRFSGYTVLRQLNPKDIIWGIDTLEELPQEIKDNNTYLENIYRFNKFCGMPSMLIHNGLIISLLFFVILKILNFKTSDLFIITIVTLTVNYTTQTSFVVLAYYLILKSSIIKEGCNQLKMLENKDRKKVLIMNEYLIYGGAEIYTLNLMDILSSKGYEVSLLCFDNDFDSKIDKINSNDKIYNIKSRLAINKMIFNPFLYYKIKKIIKNIEPDVIIVNNLFTNPITQLKALKGYKVYQVVHDYGIVCPKATSIKNDFSICLGYKTEKCVKCCKHNGSKLQLILKLKQIRKVEKIRKKIVAKLISPSECLRDYLIKFGYDAICINNPIKSDGKVCMSKSKFASKKFAYIGGVNERKGIFIFLEAFIQFAKNKDVEIDLIGKIDTKENEIRLKKILEKCDKIKYIGEVNNTQAVEYIRESYCIVVPSLWIENYPTTVLEAQSQKTLVIGSNRGGIPEMLKDNKGYIFDILNTQQIIQVLEDVYTLQEEQYDKIIDKAYKYVSQNNAFDEYAKKIVEIMEE